MSALEAILSPKYGALACLVLQNTFLVVFMRVSRTAKGDMYASSTAVAVMEVVKFVTCIGVLITYDPKGIPGVIQALHSEIVLQPWEMAKLAVPSLLYTVQNNLLYFALSHLDAATFQVGYNIKILTTAVFSVVMLNRKLSALQWIALLILTAGVVMAQYSTQNTASEPGRNTTSGFIAVLLAAITSGFSGVYFEKVVKTSGTSIWIRNIQMGSSSIVLGLIGIYASGELPGVLEKGFFHGYNPTVWSVIALQAIGGLVVAVVVKYADNILKGFAAAISILTSCTLCYFIADFHPNLIFCVGAVLVGISTYLYSYQPSYKDKSTDAVNKNVASSSASELTRLGGNSAAGSSEGESSSLLNRDNESKGSDNV